MLTAKHLGVITETSAPFPRILQYDLAYPTENEAEQ